MQLIDTHCHLSFDSLADNIENVVAESIEAGVTQWITVGTDAAHNLVAVQLAEHFENMYAAVGIHPHDAKDVIGETFEELIRLAQNKKVVAIGETGLDFHYNLSPAIDQQRVFAKHLQIAADLNLPVIIHCRDAFEETLDTLERFGSGLQRVVFHCFTGSAEQTSILLDKGYYISFTGVVTFKNADTCRAAAAKVPLDRLMIETDCPYMSPVPMRKQKVNTPALLVHTARKLAEIKGIPLEQFAEAVTATSKEFFALP